MADIEQPAWRCKKRIGHLMARLNQHAAGEIELTNTQVAAIRLYLDKTLPSLASTSVQALDSNGKPADLSLKVTLVSANHKE